MTQTGIDEKKIVLLALSPAAHLRKLNSVWGGQVVRWCWENFQCRGVLLILIKSRARAYCACSRCGWELFGHFFSRLSSLFSFSLSLGDGPIQYRLKNCLKEPLSTKQPINQLNSAYGPKSFGYAKLYN